MDFNTDIGRSGKNDFFVPKEQQESIEEMTNQLKLKVNELFQEISKLKVNELFQETSKLKVNELFQEISKLKVNELFQETSKLCEDLHIVNKNIEKNEKEKLKQNPIKQLNLDDLDKNIDEVAGKIKQIGFDMDKIFFMLKKESGVSSLKAKDYKDFSVKVKAQMEGFSKHKASVGDILCFFYANEDYLTGVLPINEKIDRDVDLGGIVLALSEEVSKKYPKEVMDKDKNDIKDIFKKMKIFGETRKVTAKESLGKLDQKNILEFVFSQLEPKDRNVAKLVSKEWKARLEKPSVVIRSINDHPEVSVWHYGFKGYKDLQKFVDENGGKFEALNLDGRSLNNEQLKSLIKKCPNLKYLRGSLEKYKDEDVNDLNATLAEVAELKKLQALHFSDCGLITDDGFAQIIKLQSLQILNLSNCSGITDSGLKEIRALSSLRELNLSNCRGITDSGLEEIGALSSLRELDLSDCRGIKDGGLFEIAKLNKLQRLNLINLNITDSGIIKIASELGKELKSLAFSYGKSSITDKGLCEIAKCEKLQDLAVFESEEMTDVGFSNLAQLQELKRLIVFGGEKITDQAFIKITECKKLEGLFLTQFNKLTDSGFIEFAKLQELNCLVLGQFEKITDKVFIEFAKCGKLKVLCVGVCPGITDVGLCEVAKLKELEHLFLVDLKNITEEGLVNIKKQTKSQELHVVNCSKIQDINPYRWKSSMKDWFEFFR